MQLFRSHRALRVALALCQKASGEKRPLLLITDVATRWNYTEIMLERFFTLSSFVKEVLLQCYHNTIPGVDFPDDVCKKAEELLDGFDVNVLDVEALVKVLRPVKLASDALEGDKGQLSLLLFVQDSLEVDLKVRIAWDVMLIVVETAVCRRPLLSCLKR